MAYELHGLVGRAEPIAHAAAELGLVPVPLPQGFALLPGPAPEADAGDALPSNEYPLWWLTLDLEWAAVAASRVGPVAYVEVEFLHGAGSQAVVLWDDGLIAVGPCREDDDERPRRVPLAGWPVNQVLRRLGVQVGDAGDEFQALGLGRHRDTEGWRGAASASTG